MSTCVVRDLNLVDGKASTDDIRQTLGMFWLTCIIKYPLLTGPLVLMQRMAFQVNRLERS